MDGGGVEEPWRCSDDVVGVEFVGDVRVLGILTALGGVNEVMGLFVVIKIPDKFNA